MRRFGHEQQAQLADTARTGVSAEDAGRAIETGIKGSGGFLERTQAVWNRLDGDLAAKVPPNTGIAPQNTLSTLSRLVTPTPGAENTTATLVNPKLAEMQKAIANDLQANNGQMPFEALRAVRSRVGAALDDSLVSGIPAGQLKQVYAALSSDMEAAANASGAGKEFARQNQYYASRMDRLENVLERVIGNTPEETFRRFMPTDPNAVTKVRAVMRSLPESERNVVTNAVVERLGRATPGQQNVAGDVFSSNTFMTNWNRLSPGAKAQIFSDPTMRKNMDALAATAGDIKEGSGVLANPSGTGQVGAWAGLAYLAAQGQVVPAAALVGGSYLGARMLTSPKVVNWLATPASQIKDPAAYMARLGVIFNESKDDALKQELTQFVTQGKQ